ncbi:hypothetical protein CKA32_002829 [Geitlerinema sp. FC II]|nr:hypothetical protein CKA32_002829 [Geitlerinema sp. FC II]
MVTISTSAQIALRSLLPGDRERVQHLLSMLDNFTRDESLRQEAKQLKGEGLNDLYIIRVDRDLRILFRYSKDDVEILDIMTHSRLEKIHG